MASVPRGSPAWRSLEPRGGANGSRVHGTLDVPGSKSIAQRLLVLASLCGERTRIAGLPPGDEPGSDAGAARGVARAVAREYGEPAPAAVTIVGTPPGPHRGWNPGASLAVGESGTLARLVLAALGLCGYAGRTFSIEVEGTLRRRSSRALVGALERAGVGLAGRGGAPAAETLALDVRPVGPPSELRLEQPSSSQEVSALLVALAAYPGAHVLEVRGAIPSLPYLDLTVAVLREFGVTVEVLAGDRARTSIHVRGPLRAREAPWVVEPDASSAAVALAAACLSGGALTVPRLGPGALQGDVRIVEHLRAFGCETGADARGLWARGAPSRGAALDLEREPDLAPVLAAVAAAAALAGGGGSVLHGLGTLPGKESSRIEVLAAGLAAAGFAAEAGPDSLRIGPPRATAARGAERIALDPRGDHRMAFAFALLGLVVPGVAVLDPQCVRKSWPGFWRDLERAGARVGSG
jgi:3-phosphoshikimate 1-carboxyvinyltransferase